jgi:uncharacterized protein (DUF488 family)
MVKIFTIGHSNQKWSNFTVTLKDNHIDVIIDVRRYPGSKTCPQFNKGEMIQNVSYVHIEEGESDQISKDLNTMIIVDGKTRALEPMLITWPLHHLEMVSMRYFHL